MTARHNRYRSALRVYQATSRDAWHTLTPAELGEVDAKILRVVSYGATCDDVERMTGLSHQTASAQIRHMVEAGLIEATGEKRATRSGRTQAMVWRIAATTRTGPKQAPLFADLTSGVD